MKRSSSESTSEEDQKPNITPSKETKKSPQKVKPENGEWDPEKRATFMDLVIAAGYKAINLDEVASTVSPPKSKI
jgi:ABC-type sugar transport system substrate-binding protein